MWLLESKFTFRGLVYAFRYFLISFILGIGLGSSLAFKLGFLLVLFFGGLFCLSEGFKKSHYPYWLLGLCIIGIVLGTILGNHAFLVLKDQRNFLQEFQDTEIILTGKVLKTEKTQKGIYVILKTETINNKRLPSDKANICLYLNQNRQIEPFSLLRLKGSLLISEKLSLNCRAYLTGGKILEEVAPQHKSIWGVLLIIRNKIHLQLARNIREPFLSLAKGYILGDDKATNVEVADLLQKNSMTHIVAVSGFNIAIIFLMANRLFSFFHLSPHKTFYFTLILGTFFILLAEYPSSASRAGIMLSLALGAERLQRMGNSINIILLAATLMLIFNPLILIYDLGFQLSFLASLGLIFRQILSPKKELINSRAQQLKATFQDIFKDTIYVLFFVSPLLAYYQGIISLKPLLANLPLLPLMPAVTFLIILLLFSSFWFPGIAVVLGFLVEKIIASQISILKIVSQLNFLNFKVGYLFFYWIILYYLLLAFVLRFKIREARVII
jgi:competence protein ComEC